jgi:drug/metabolite transporter (DMT)-like permease
MQRPWIDWILFTALCVIWGSSFFLMKVGMRELSAYQVASIRILSAGLVLLPFVKKAWQSIPRAQVGRVMLSGLIGSFFPAFLFCMAETKIDSALAGILNALTPLFTLLVGILFFQLKARLLQILGTLIGFLGLTLLMVSGTGFQWGNIGYSMLVILATLFYGLNVNMVGRHMKGIGALDIASLAFVMLIPPSALILAYSGFFQMPLLNKSVLLSIATAGVLGIVGTAIASIIFYMLVKRAGPVFASMVTYGIPFVAVFWGILRNEQINGRQFFCLLIILVGVYLVNKPQKKADPVVEAADKYT